jgi:hypothetical protein
MSHYAHIQNGIVTSVIVAEQSFINSGAMPSDGKQYIWNKSTTSWVVST